MFKLAVINNETMKELQEQHYYKVATILRFQISDFQNSRISFLFSAFMSLYICKTLPIKIQGDHLIFMINFNNISRTM